MECLDKELEARGWAGGEDELLPHASQVRRCQQQRHLSTHIQPQFLVTLFDVARPNLRINGRTTEEPSEVEEDDNVEPFDGALNRHIWSLSDQRLKWDKDIAEHQRTRPKISRLWFSLGKTQNETTYDFIAGECSVVR